jgi:hypothetical protein
MYTNGPSQSALGGEDITQVVHQPGRDYSDQTSKQHFHNVEIIPIVPLVLVRPRSIILGEWPFLAYNLVTNLEESDGKICY